MSRESSVQDVSPNSSSDSLGLSSALSSPSSDVEIHSPNDYKYYHNNFDKSQFNLTLINCAIYLIKLLYNANDSGVEIKMSNLRYFILQILKRSKTSIQILQISCFYLLKLVKSSKSDLPENPKHLFLGLIILASKFNQDANYSFKTWAKICGLNSEDKDQIKFLKQLEIKLLNALDYNLYVSNHTYENWCNILFIFGYDFIKVQKIFTCASKSEIVWDSDESSIDSKLSKWTTFLNNLNLTYLNQVEIKFINYYLGQFNSKVFIINSLFNKRSHSEAGLDDVEVDLKSKVLCK